MTILFIIMAVVFFYPASVGLLRNWYAEVHGGDCKNCSKGLTYRIRRNGKWVDPAEPGDFHKEDSFFQVVFWPLTISYYITKSMNPKNKHGRATIKRYWDEKEIEDNSRHIARLEQKAGIR